jgi:hypothetical protein
MEKNFYYCNIKNKKNIAERAYYLAFHFYNKYLRESLKIKYRILRRNEQLINEYYLNLRKRMSNDGDYLAFYINHKALIYFIWKRDMEYSSYNYRDYKINRHNEKNYFISNRDIFNIISELENKLRQIIDDNHENVIYNILIQVSVIYLAEKFNRLKQNMLLYEDYSMYCTYQDATTPEGLTEQLLILIDKQYNYKIYIYDKKCE